MTSGFDVVVVVVADGGDDDDGGRDCPRQILIFSLKKYKMCVNQQLYKNCRQKSNKL